MASEHINMYQHFEREAEYGRVKDHQEQSAYQAAFYWPAHDPSQDGADQQ